MSSIQPQMYRKERDILHKWESLLNKEVSLKWGAARVRGLLVRGSHSRNINNGGYFIYSHKLSGSRPLDPMPNAKKSRRCPLLHETSYTYSLCVYLFDSRFGNVRDLHGMDIREIK